MALSKRQAVAMQIPFNAQIVEVTHSPQFLYHYITDSELERLSEMQKDSHKDICLAAVGGFIGSAIPAMDGIFRFGDIAHPMTKTDLFSLCVACVTFGVAGITGILWRRKSRTQDSAVGAIRARPKMLVQVGQKSAA